MEEINILDSKMRSYSYASSEITIGRSSKNDLCLPDGAVSRKHAVVRKKFGGFIIQDLGSSNGTFVNGQKVKEKPIGANDVIKMGNTILFFHTTKEEAKKKVAEMKKTSEPKPSPEDEKTSESDFTMDD
ncbi:MAG: FHA domain-containing protein [Planctomycetota bacterium]|jgi:pSer/pThr/pTyr-binding forkhead associated (FHA) protein